MLTAQEEQIEMTSKDLYKELPSDDEIDGDYALQNNAVSSDDESDDEDQTINHDEIAAIATEAVCINPPACRFSGYRNTISQIDFKVQNILIQSDDEDDEYIDELESDEEPEECEEIEIESEEVADNVINSNYLVRHELLKKSGKVLRDGKELPAEFDDLAVRIESILKQ